MRSYADIRESLIELVEANSQFSDLDNESSLVGQLLSALALQLSQVYADTQTSNRINDIGAATGETLDRIGELYGLTRRPASKANSTFGVVFYTATGTPWSQATITIPAGTRIWNKLNPDLLYVTLNDVVFTQNSTIEAEVSVEAIDYGARFNIPPGTLDIFDYRNLFPSIRVTNTTPIDSGADVESDEAFRDRILAAVRNVSNQYTIEAMRARLLAAPGVLDVIPYIGRRGTGTVDFICVTDTGVLSNELAERLSGMLAELLPPFDIVVRGPATSTVACTINIILDSDVNSETLVRRSVQGQIVQYINGKPLGSSITAEELEAVARNTPGVQDAILVRWSRDGVVIPANGFIVADQDTLFRAELDGVVIV